MHSVTSRLWQNVINANTLGTSINYFVRISVLGQRNKFHPISGKTNTTIDRQYQPDQFCKTIN